MPFAQTRRVFRLGVPPLVETCSIHPPNFKLLTMALVRRWQSAPVVGRQLARKFSTSLAGVPKIAVVGVGGAGGNAVNNMIERGDFPDHIHFVAANTDAQALESSLTPHRIRLGAALTGGLGAGARPEVGRSAAMASYAAIDEQLRGRSMCFITAGMGGGTGTGAAPVIARAAKEAGLLTVAVVSRPFGFEGTKREKLARQGSMVKTAPLGRARPRLLRVLRVPLAALSGSTLPGGKTWPRCAQPLPRAPEPAASTSKAADFRLPLAVQARSGGAAARGRHADRGAQPEAARGGLTRHDLRHGLPHGRRRAPPRSARHHGPHPHAGPGQPRLCRRVHGGMRAAPTPTPNLALTRPSRSPSASPLP